MSRGVLVAALVAFAFGCASGGGGNDLPPVQVFASTEELPCEYEVVETVSGSSSRRSSSLADYERIRDDVLGRAGADIGADAVIAPEIDERGTQRRVVVGGGVVQPPGPPPILRFTGEAIRFIPGTCRSPE